MAIKGEWIRYGSGSGYFAKPERAGKPLPAVLVIQEIGGVNANIKGIAERIAAAGYAALAPDLFAVDGQRLPALTEERIDEGWAFAARCPPGSMFDPIRREAELAKLGEEEQRRIGETFGTIFSFASPEKALSLIPALSLAIRHLRDEREETRGQAVGCVGFCMGGGLSALLSCEEPELSAAAVFYGMSPPAEAVAKSRCPVLGFYGGTDQRVNAGLPAFREAMEKAGRDFESHVYEGVNHAFFNDDAQAYDVAASRDAFARLLAFFRAKLTT